MQAAASDAVADYIVLFKPGVRNQNDLTSALLRAPGAVEKARYQVAVQGFSATLSASALEGIRSNPSVQLVERDAPVRAVGEQTLSASQWGLDRLDTRANALDGRYSYDADGTGVAVYILDTGIKLSQPEFGGRASFFRNYSTSTSNDDVQGHGTHVAGTVGGATVGVAKNVSLFAVKVLGDDGSGYYSWVISGIDAVTAAKTATPSRPIVGNMSLAGGLSSAVNTAVNNSVAAGVVWSVAAGNSNADACTASPASATSALTVGATTSSDARADYSNFGVCVDVFAPGTDIYSSTNSGGYVSWSGTSMAAPHVAGAAALFLSANPTASATTVNNWVVSNASPGLVTSAGTGSPNRLLYTRGLNAPQSTSVTLTVTRAGNGAGTVTSTPAGINCGATCSAAFSPGTTVTLTATPATGSTFTGWTGACSNSSGTCTVTLDAAKSVAASFAMMKPMHVGNQATSKTLGKSNWSASLTVTMHDVNHNLLAGVLVDIAYGDSPSGTTNCTTDVSGTCTVTRSGLKNSSFTFTVTGTSKSGYTSASSTEVLTTSSTITRL